MNNDFSNERYSRQVLLREFGESGQEKLSQAKVIVIGAGGLGCPALQYLAAAGVGTIGVIDDDKVALSNLHRQPLYATEDVGSFKSIVAAKRLRQLNPGIVITSFNERLTASNACEILEPFDIIVDGSDNFATRYLVNDACVLLDKPLVYGAVSKFEGQVAVFNYKPADDLPAVNYRDIFPQPPAEDEVLNCAEAGVLGVLPGIIGAMQANETIKLITGIGKPLANRLLTFNALDNQSYELTIKAAKETRLLIPATKEVFKATNYEWLCTPKAVFWEIDNARFDELIGNSKVLFIDVRETNERPAVTEFRHQRVPMSALQQMKPGQDIDTIVVFCQTGKRSLEAAKYFASLPGAPAVFSLRRGIVQWKQQHQTETV